MGDPLLYSLTSAAEQLGGIAVLTLRRWIAEGEIPVVRLGRRVFIRRRALADLLRRAERRGRAARTRPTKRGQAAEAAHESARRDGAAVVPPAPRHAKRPAREAEGAR